jgi:hypothetical protein
VRVAGQRVQALVRLHIRDDTRLILEGDGGEVEQLEVLAARRPVESEQLDAGVGRGELRCQADPLGRPAHAVGNAETAVLEHLAEPQAREAVDEAPQLLVAGADVLGLAREVGRGSQHALVEQRLQLRDSGDQVPGGRRLGEGEEGVAGEGGGDPLGQHGGVLLTRHAPRDLDPLGAEQADPVLLVQVDKVARFRDPAAGHGVDLRALDVLGQHRVAVEQAVQPHGEAKALGVLLGELVGLDQRAQGGVVEGLRGQALGRDRLRLGVVDGGDRHQPVDASRRQVGLQLGVRRDREVLGQLGDGVDGDRQRRHPVLGLLEGLGRQAARLERVDQVGLQVAALLGRDVHIGYGLAQGLRRVREVLNDRRLRALSGAGAQARQQLGALPLQLRGREAGGGVEPQQLSVVHDTPSSHERRLHDVPPRP